MELRPFCAGLSFALDHRCKDNPRVDGYPKQLDIKAVNPTARPT